VEITSEQVREALLFLSALILSISVHEFGHAWFATKLGDPLPRSDGRVTLSPRAHVDPIGTIAFPLVMFFAGGGLLGWGRPVMTNSRNYTRYLSVAGGRILVAVAGPLMNLTLAALVSLLLVVTAQAGVLPEGFFLPIFKHLVALNLFLMWFNLIPLPPLDGGALLEWALPDSKQHIITFLNKWGFLILLAMMMTPPIARLLLYPAGLLIGSWQLTLARMAFG
jgi:Zn-dependent protease